MVHIMTTDDVFSELYDAEADLERGARVGDLKDETRPYVDELTRAYGEYLARFGMDDAKAFQALIMFVKVGIEIGKYDQDALVVLIVFMARRLSYAKPNLARTLN